MNTSPTLLILAAGLGSRYKGLKQIDRLTNSGETLMEFALYDACKLGIEKFVFVINDRFPEAYRTTLTDLLKSEGSTAVFVVQKKDKFIPERFRRQLRNRKKPLGTAHAVYCAKEVIDGPFITINTDDFYGRETFKTAVQYIDTGKITADNFAMVAFQLNRTLSPNGSVSRGICKVGREKLQCVEEVVKIEKKSGKITGVNPDGERIFLSGQERVSMNCWLLHPRFFRMIEESLYAFLSTERDWTKEEFYLPSVVEKGLATQKLMVCVLQTAASWFGMTYPEDRSHVVRKLTREKELGRYPEKLWR